MVHCYKVHLAGVRGSGRALEGEGAMGENKGGIVCGGRGRERERYSQPLFQGIVPQAFRPRLL